MTTDPGPVEFADVRLPTLFLSHGAPPLADDQLWKEELAMWSRGLPKPSSVLMISAHWEADPLTVGATTTVPLVYDFWGFARRYYEVTYPAPGAPKLAGEVAALLGATGHQVRRDSERGLDHGAYVPLKEMYPEADVPVLQISMPTLEPLELFDLGRRLAPLRDQGVLIVGSGFSTHNLRAVDMSRPSDYAPPSWSEEFDHWLSDTLDSGNLDALIGFQHHAPAAFMAHPRTEHFAPLFVALGAAAGDLSAGRTTIEGFWYGLSKRSMQFD